jgi:hypothetical protein
MPGRLDNRALRGSPTVCVRNYGIEAPQGASGFVSVDPESSLVLTKQ